MKVLFCIYTCNGDADHLHQFKQSKLFEFVSAHPNFEVIEVYANSEITETTFEDGKLTLVCPDDYRQLSVKTYEMIRECVERFDFDFLIKCDCNVFDRKRYRPDKLLDFIQCKSCYKHYYGIYRVMLTPEIMNGWRTIKGLKESVPGSFRLMYPGKSRFPFFGGKFYVVSRDFCRYISCNGKKVAGKYVIWFNGTEDQMVGWLYQRFKKGV